MRTGITRGAGLRSETLGPEQARDFAASLRGQFIISQALVVAASILDDQGRPEQYREPSNAADMLYLAKNLYPIYLAVEQANADMRRATYVCLQCDKTVPTSEDEGGTGLCQACFDEGGARNHHNDTHDHYVPDCPWCHDE